MRIKLALLKLLKSTTYFSLKNLEFASKRGLRYSHSMGLLQVCRAILLFSDDILRLNSILFNGMFGGQSNLVTVLNDILSFLPVMLSLIGLQISQCPGMKTGRCEYGKNGHLAQVYQFIHSQQLPTLFSIFKSFPSRFSFICPQCLELGKDWGKPFLCNPCYFTYDLTSEQI